MGRIDKELLNYHSKYSKDGVLINKLDIENEEELNKAERLITSYKLSKMYLRDEEISFDVSYYLNIHKELFGDIYPFAGEIRNEVIAKRIPFCLPQNIYPFLEDTLNRAKKRAENINSYDELLRVVVEVYSDLDITHPFREGNGRCEREFIRRYIDYICKKNNLDPCFLNYSLIEDKDKYIDAVVKADATLDYSDLYVLFQSILEKKNVVKKSNNK